MLKVAVMSKGATIWHLTFRILFLCSTCFANHSGHVRAVIIITDNFYNFFGNQVQNGQYKLAIQVFQVSIVDRF